MKIPVLEMAYNREQAFRDCKGPLGCNCNSFPSLSQTAEAQTLSVQNNSAQQGSVLYLSKFHYSLHLQGVFHYITLQWVIRMRIIIIVGIFNENIFIMGGGVRNTRKKTRLNLLFEM